MQQKVHAALAIAALLVGCASPPPPPAAPPPAQTRPLTSPPTVLWVGTFQPTGDSTRVADAASPTGHVRYGPLMALERTSRVPLRIGSTFGVAYIWEESSQAPRHTVVWRFPSPGIKDARLGKTHTEFALVSEPRSCSYGNRCIAIWHLSEDKELLAGRWTVEIHSAYSAPLIYHFELVGE